MSQLLQDLKALVEMGLEFDIDPVYGTMKEIIAINTEGIVFNYTDGQQGFISFPTIEWVDNKIVEVGVGYHFLIDYCYEYKVWIYTLDDISNKLPTSQHSKRLDASVSLLRKLWESKEIIE